MSDHDDEKWAQEPKPCPFCGGISIIKGEYVHCVNEACTLFYVPIGIGNWNRRPGEDALRAERNQARRNCLHEVELLSNEQEKTAELCATITSALDVLTAFMAIFAVDSPVTTGYIMDTVDKAKAVIAKVGNK